ncbi:MAG: arsenite methyltransferase [Planctomycetaceae bacterium]
MSTRVIDAVKANYGAVARGTLSGEHDGVRAIAEAFGYSPDELAAIPAEANMGLSCGNPTATANLRPGEVVVDLGCGGGMDVFLAATKVGPTGRSIGIDMTEDMIDRARKNAERGPGGAPVSNVEFHLAMIDDLPLDEASVDCVISNCVINLAPDKAAVFREVARVLRPGGRLAVSDIALKKSLPAEIEADIAALVGCIGGALPIDDYRRMLLDAGFDAVSVIDAGADLNAYTNVVGQSGCCTPEMNEPSNDLLPVVELGSCSSGASAADRADATVHAQLADLLSRYDINEYAASVKVFAVKPAG